MASLGLNRNINLINELDITIELYKEILMNIFEGQENDINKLSEFNKRVIDLIRMEELNEGDSTTRDVFVDKFINLLDIIDTYRQIKRRK